MTGRIVHLEPDEHVAVQMLLPWYLGGRLDAAEHARVEAHLATCAECRKELEAERVLQGLQAASTDPAAMSAMPDVDAGWSRMRRRLVAEAPAGAHAAVAIDDEAVAAAATHAPLDVPRAAAVARRWPRARPAHPARPVSRAWAAPALLSVALVVAIGVTLRPVPAAGEYHALAAPATDGGTAVVRFRPDATEAQIRAGLKACGARLVDGPTVTDAYVVRLPRETYTAALEKLRRQPAVALVEALEPASPP